jgi:hypothetical protein
MVGLCVGAGVGVGVGRGVGAGIGTAVGAGTGTAVGAGMGSIEGPGEGAGTGTAVGAGMGSIEGAGTGTAVGAGTVGWSVGSRLGGRVGTGGTNSTQVPAAQVKEHSQKSSNATSPTFWPLPFSMATYTSTS